MPVHSLAREEASAHRSVLKYPPEPKSKWLGFDAYQTWEVVRSPETGKAVIKRYVVDDLKPMPGSDGL